jgi:putative SOS response-associated peptidase YedK
MCGRFTLRASPELLLEEFDLVECPLFPPRYNIAPTQTVPIVRLRHDGAGREAVPMRWGLIPFWAKDRKIGSRMINARADSLATKPAFRAAFKQRRCLVPADGFYEWKQGVTPKQPVYIHRASDRPFAFAGLWEHWEGEGETIESFTIVTTEANAELRALHDRMPVILEKKDHALWLDSTKSGADQVQALLRPFSAEPMVLTHVETWVNSPRHDDPRCLQPIPV